MRSSGQTISQNSLELVDSAKHRQLKSSLIIPLGQVRLHLDDGVAFDGSRYTSSSLDQLNILTERSTIVN